MRLKWIDAVFLAMVWGAAYLACLARFTARLAITRD